MLVRSDLPAGLQTAQVAHAAFEFADHFPDVTSAWIKASNYIVVLGVPDEQTLLDYADEARQAEHPFWCVYEPDVEAHTAVVFAPGAFCQRFANLPLALREAAMA